MKRLMLVEDVFQISGWGLIVVPSPFVGSYEGPAEIEVELRRPDGSVERAVAHPQYVFPKPTPKVPVWEVIFRDLDKSQVPVGTEIWTAE